MEQIKAVCLLSHELHDVRDTTLGIIGYGSIGRSMAQLAQGVGMRVLIAERRSAPRVREGRTEFTQTLKQSDVFSLHCPLTDETRNLFGLKEFELMKRNALLINTARGALVNDQALAEALQRGLISGAAIDVLREEPPVAGSPLLDLNLPNFIITPHVAWASKEAMQALADQVIENIEAFVAGKPRNLLT